MPCVVGSFAYDVTMTLGAGALACGRCVDAASLRFPWFAMPAALCLAVLLAAPKGQLGRVTASCWCHLSAVRSYRPPRLSARRRQRLYEPTFGDRAIAALADEIPELAAKRGEIADLPLDLGEMFAGNSIRRSTGNFLLRQPATRGPDRDRKGALARRPDRRHSRRRRQRCTGSCPSRCRHRNGCGRKPGRHRSGTHCADARGLAPRAGSLARRPSNHGCGALQSGLHRDL